MDNKIELESAVNGYDLTVKRIMEKEDGIKEIFANRLDRLAASPYSCIILFNKQVAGFANLVKEKNNDDFLFVDMGIIASFRGKSICNDVLKYFGDIEIKEFIIGETKIDNIPANKVASNVGCFIFAEEDRNFYLIQKNRYCEFIKYGYLDKLKQHIEKPNVKKLIINR